MRLRRWSSLSLHTKGLLVVALPVLPLACFWGVVAVTQWRQPPPANTALRNLQVQAGLARTLNALLEADSGVRDYLLTDNHAAKTRYHNAVNRLPPTMTNLDHLVIDAGLHESIAFLRGLVDQEISVLAGLAGEPMETTPDLGERAALDRSSQLMERIRNTVATIEQSQMSLAEDENARDRLARRDMLVLLALGSVGCTAGGVIAALLLARGISRRHAVLADNVGRLAKGLPPRPLPAGDVEIAWLDRQFRDAADLLRRREDELRQAVRGLETTNRELESFSYSVSHDLRAPLRAINGFSLALEEDWGGRLDDEGRDALRRIRTGATRMGLLIDDLLALSRITRMDLKRERVDLSGVARAITGDLEQRMPDRTVDVRIEPEVFADADARMMRIALENLMDNAWKFTKNAATARIEVGAFNNGGPPVYFVRDNGAGFDMRYADHLFGAFQRLHNDAEFSGTGIGLTTVQRIVHRHGGRIWAEAAVDQGASFYFTLTQGRRGT